MAVLPLGMWDDVIDVVVTAFKGSDNIVPDIANISDNIVGDVIRPGYLDDVAEVVMRDIGVYGREVTPVYDDLLGTAAAEAWGLTSKIDTEITDVALVTGRETVESGITDITRVAPDLTGTGRDIGGVSAKIAPDLTGTGRDIGGVVGREVAETGLKDATKPGLISKVVGAGEDVTAALGKITGFAMEHKLAVAAVGGLGLGVLYLGSVGGGNAGGSNPSGNVSLCVGLSGPELTACQNKNTYKSETGTGDGAPTSGGKDVCDVNSAALGNSFASCKSCLTKLNLTGRSSITTSEQKELQYCINLAGPSATGTGEKGTTGTGTGTGGKGATGTGGGGGGNTPGNICDLSGLGASDLAKCKSCLTTLQLPDVTLTMGAPDKAKLQACMNSGGSATGTGSPGGNICELSNLPAASLAACKSCLTTLQLPDVTMNMIATDKAKLQACMNGGGSATGTGGGGDTPGNICDLANLPAASLAICKSCLDTLKLPDVTLTMSASDKAKLQGCISGGGSATGTGPNPTGPGPNPTGDMCDTAGLTAEQKLVCKMCQQQGFTAEDSLKMCYACNTQSNIVSAGLATTCTSCVKSGNVTTDSLATCLKAHPGGGTGTTPTAATSAEVAAMAAARAAGKSPCSASGLSAAVQSACSQCYQTGMTEAQLVACVNGKLVAATGGTGAVAVATLKKYAIPIALGVAVVGGVAYATHGKYWGKKGSGKTPAKYVPPKPVKPRHK